jgi:hypothetical protein
MSFILDPHASANAAAAENDRFVSMSVTRNPSAVVIEPHRPFMVRQTMRLDDIEGSRPKSNNFSRSNFHDTHDIEGAQPKVLHAEKRNHPALALTNHDIEGEFKNMFAIDIHFFSTYFFFSLTFSYSNNFHLLFIRICSSSKSFPNNSFS